MAETPNKSDASQSKAGGESAFAALIRLMVNHANAANLLMVLMIGFGLYGATQINRQFFPDLTSEVVTATIVWPGAGAEDVDLNIVEPVQAAIRYLDGVEDLSTSARTGRAGFTIEYAPGWDMSKAVREVQSAIDGLNTLPTDIERPIIREDTPFEPVGSILLIGDLPERAMVRQAKKLRDGLLDAGLDKVSMTGLRDEEIWVETFTEQLRRYGITNDTIATAIRTSSLDLPGGLVRGQTERQIRSKGLAKTPQSIGEIEVVARDTGQRVLVRDIAQLSEAFETDQKTAWVGRKRAIQLLVQRSETTDSLDALAILRSFAAEARNDLPAGFELKIYAVSAEKISQRLSMMLRNGIGGFVLVTLALFLFLNFRVAIWVAAGIPIAILMTIGLMVPFGMSLNMITMFAFIMMLGVIVDDAIVVGEHASALYAEGGLTPAQAAQKAALRMARPIFAAGLTTLAAFSPIIIIEGTFGRIVGVMPVVVAAVLIASLIECYFVLPMHMKHALSSPQGQAGGIRRRFRNWFDDFRLNRFPKKVAAAIERRYETVSFAIAALIIAIGLLAGGWLQFSFFPSPETENMEARIYYHSGTPKERTVIGMKTVEAALLQTDKELRGEGPSLIHGYYGLLGGTGNFAANNVASVQVELTPSEARDIRTKDFIRAWQKNIPVLTGTRRVVVTGHEAGPGGVPINFVLVGDNVDNLKQAAEELKQALELYPAVINPRDNLRYGRQELLLEVNERGAALGFTNQMVGRQVRNTFEGIIATRFARDNSEVTVRVLLSRRQEQRQSLEDFYLAVPNSVPQRYIALGEVVDMKEETGFMFIRRSNSGREVSVLADYADDAGNPEAVMRDVRQNVLPDLAMKYNITEASSKRAREMAKFAQGFMVGTGLALTLIYIILALVFSSYTRPFVIMSIIPFGLIGALFGHFVQGFDISFLSLIALLGLSGILVNNSIILIGRIEELQATGMALREAIITGVTDRLRPVVLTSMTTVLGLTPILFETSVQAQFVIPIALTMAWGMASASFLVLFVVPAILMIQEDFRLWREGRAGHAGRMEGRAESTEPAE